MATEKQIAANRKNAEKSCGPTSPEGLLAAMRNSLGHGLCSVENFTILFEENLDKFEEFLASFHAEHKPETETESTLVRRMAESQWLISRALRLQASCLKFAEEPSLQKLSLFIRYQATHERAFYKALNEFQKLREQKTKAEIGFVSQELKKSAEIRAAESQNLRKEMFEFKKTEFAFKKESVWSKKAAQQVPIAPEIEPIGFQMAA
jgi:hypothetical protein